MPCVGRERELSVIKAALSAGVEEPSAVVVLLTGAAGIGKSRLMTEVVERLRVSEPRLEVMSARGDATRAGSPFAMLSELIRCAAGIEGCAPLGDRQAALRARVARHVAGAAVERVTTFLGEVAGAPFPAEPGGVLASARGDPILMGDHIRRAFEDWLEAECADHPVLLRLDDLHAGDLPTVLAVGAALRHLRERPLLTLAAARPEVTQIFPTLWADRGVTAVRLQELGQRSAEQLVRLALGKSTPESVVTLIVERAAGNPFFLEELIRAVADGRGAAALPATLVATVQARLEQLLPEERHVLRAASVFGDVFWQAAVAALLGGEERAVGAPELVQRLVDRELIVRRATRRFPDQEDHAFRSALVREAAYSTLTEADRSLGHRLAAGWLQAHDETDPRILAAHHDRGGERSRAVDCYAQVASSALGGNDFDEAIACVEHAVRCGAAGVELGALRLRQAEAHRWRGDFVEAERRGLEAVELLPRGSDTWMAAVGEMATVLGKLGRVDQVINLGQDLLLFEGEAPGHATDAHVVCISRTYTALLLMGQRDVADALWARLAHRMSDPSSATPLAAAAYHRARAFRAPFCGETGLSGRYFELSADAFDRAGDVRNACLQRANVGASCMEVGDYEGAMRVLRPTIVEAERMGAHHIVSSAKRDLGVSLVRLGRWAEAEQLTREAVAELEAHGDRRLGGIGHADLALVHLFSGDLPRAEDEARIAAARLEISPAYQCPALALLARVLVRRDRPLEALEHANRALAILEEVGALEEGEGVVRLALFEALRALGRRDEARAVLARAASEVERRAATIDDPDARRMFLENIAEHRETLALWSLAQGDVSAGGDR